MRFGFFIEFDKEKENRNSQVHRKGCTCGEPFCDEDLCLDPLEESLRAAMLRPPMPCFCGCSHRCKCNRVSLPLLRWSKLN